MGKKKRAAALEYNPADGGAPILTAFGEGFMAERIIEKANEVGVPVVPDGKLASALSKLGVGDEIPNSLYEVVARVLIFVGDVDRGYGEKLRNAAKND